MSRRALLPGTFDPVHVGHLELAKTALHAGALDEVWLMVNPHDGAARASHKGETASLDDRVAMAELAVQGADGLTVYRGAEWERPHTIDTFRRILRDDERLLFITGMDTVAHLDRWDDVESVVNNATFMVAHRDGASVALIDDLRKRLGGLGSRLDVQLFEFDGYKDVSSTEIRERLRAGERPEGLDTRVYEYILARNLYR